MVGHASAGANLAFPDLQAEIHYLVGEGDLVSAWLTWKSTHTGEFAGVSGSGRAMRIAGGTSRVSKMGE